ncbi:MAG: sigma-70 family RNA polymerase sigma factor [Acidobacteriota bacterium]|nr:sigma-70 family RNA polymerase sigma factor [Acidobacteriota bacterium]
MSLGTRIASPEPGWTDKRMVAQNTVGRTADDGPEALAEAYDRHHCEIFSLAMRVVQDQGDAESVTQAVFSQAWNEARTHLAKHDALALWLLGITRSLAIDCLRSRRTRQVPKEQAVVELPDPAAGLDRTPLTRESASHLRDALNALPQSQRVAIELAYFEGLTQTQIAERIDEPRSIVKNRVLTGLLTLRKTLTP